MITKYVELNLASFGILKYDYAIKTREMFNFLPLRNSSVTIEFSFLLLIISVIVPSTTFNILCSLPLLHS